MATDRTENGLVPAANLPEIQGKFRAPVATTLVGRLVPTVDKIRQLYTTFGLRSYRVFLVHIQWSGLEVGAGTPIEISRREILPVPQVMDMNSTTEVLRSFGLTEEGGLVIQQISIRYTEDDLMGRTPDIEDPEVPRTGREGCEFFWEVVEMRKSNPPPVPRIYVPSAAPNIDKSQFSWNVVLTKRDYNRGRDFKYSRWTR